MICLLIIIVSEYYFDVFLQDSNISSFTLILLFMFIQRLFHCFLSIVEKYLLEYITMNTFKLLMIEGTFGLIISLLYCLVENPFKNINLDNKENWFIFTSIFCLVIYFLSSGARNVYRILTNKYFSPTTYGLALSFLDPLLITCYFIFNNDFMIENNNNNNNINYYYFFLNLILLLIMDLCGCIYNEIIIIYCRKLEEDTHIEIYRRSYTETETEIELEGWENIEKVDINNDYSVYIDED